MRNEKTLGVKNGSLGTIERIEGGVIQVKLDGPSDTRVAVDTKFYSHLDHGYAATVHKAQGTTVDRTYVLATPHFDRHTAYVALSRHREAATVFYATDDFGGRGGRLDADQVQARFVERLSRVQAKDLAHDYLHTPEGQRAEGSAAPAGPGVSAAPKQTLEEIRAAAREHWRKDRALVKESGQASMTPEEIRRQGREDWLTRRAEIAQEGVPASERAVPSAAKAALQGAPAERRETAVPESERLAALSAAELWAQIDRIKPQSVERLVELDVTVVAARRVAEGLQGTALQALNAERLASQEAGYWRREHGLQAKLHDLGVLKAGYLVERERAQAAAKRTRAEALKAARPAEHELQRARTEADRRITKETAPARARVPELERLAHAAHERERVVREFQHLAQGRAARRPGYLDTSEDWQATPKVLRDAIERYNREPPAVQSEILKALAVQPEATRVIEQAIKLRHEQVRELDRGLGL
jgi:hypothetical protein